MGLDVEQVHLENRIRDVLGFDGAPIKLVFRNRGSDRPRRRRAGTRRGGARAGTARRR